MNASFRQPLRLYERLPFTLHYAYACNARHLQVHDLAVIYVSSGWHRRLAVVTSRRDTYCLPHMSGDINMTWAIIQFPAAAGCRRGWSLSAPLLSHSRRHHLRMPTIILYALVIRRGVFISAVWLYVMNAVTAYRRDAVFSRRTRRYLSVSCSGYFL